MKIKILAGLLTVSVLLNVAGLVFFICFLNLQGHYRAIKRERNLMVNNLAALRGASVLTEALDTDKVIKRPFASLADGLPDEFGLVPPALVDSTLDNTLVVYLHGMGSTYLEPFVYPAGQSIAEAITSKYPRVCLLSVSYRKDASWGNDAAVADLNQNVREVMQQYPFKRIVIVGTSMGGCTALNYAATAPADIKSKITGVVSVESAGDLFMLYRTSRHPAIAPAMIRAFNGTPEQIPLIYQQKSFFTNIDSLSPQVKVAVVSAREDKIVPPGLQKEIVHQLEAHQRKAKLIELDGGHGAPPAPVYVEAFEWVSATQ